MIAAYRRSQPVIWLDVRVGNHLMLFCIYHINWVNSFSSGVTRVGVTRCGN